MGTKRKKAELEQLRDGLPLQKKQGRQALKQFAANDFKATLTEGAGLKDTDYITRSGAIVYKWNPDDVAAGSSSTTNDIVVGEGLIDFANQGSYKVSYSTKKSDDTYLTTIAGITLSDRDPVINPTNGEALVTDDTITVTSAEGASFSSAKYVNRAKALA